MQKALNIYITRYTHTVDERKARKKGKEEKKAKIKQQERKEKSLRKA